MNPIRNFQSSTTLFLIVCMGLLSSHLACNPGNNQSLKKDGDGPTYGQINISVDANYMPIIDSELTVFHSSYPNAKIMAHYKSEAEVVEDLLKDSSRLALISRKLRPDELKIFDTMGYKPKMVKIAHDAIALIVNPANPDTSLTKQEIRKILTGEVKKWNELNPKGRKDVIKVVFDHEFSGTVRYAIDSICSGDKLSSNVFAAKTNEEVVNYVAENPAAIGIIGVNWISDNTDPQAQRFMRKVIAVAVAAKQGLDYYKPFQAYIATKDYPFTRTLYSVNREARKGLGTGFAAFMAGDRGQRIILLSGLVPATMPLRIMAIDNEPLNLGNGTGK